MIIEVVDVVDETLGLSERSEVRLRNPEIAATMSLWDPMPVGAENWANPKARLIRVLESLARRTSKTAGSIVPVPIQRYALDTLAAIDDEAAEEGYPPPSEVAKRNAGRVLAWLAKAHSRDLDVYPTEDAEVAVDVAGAKGCGVLVLFGSAGGATCFVTMNGDNRRARYKDGGRLPDAFLKEAMAELEARA